MPIDPEYILVQAEEFRRAQVRLEGIFPDQDGTLKFDQAVLAPMTVCSAFALELYLKFAIAALYNADPPPLHDLKALFDKLPRHWQDAVRATWNSPLYGALRQEKERRAGFKYPDCDRALQRSASAFEHFRYTFESKSSCEYFGGPIIEGLREKIFSSFPAYSGRRLRHPLNPNSDNNVYQAYDAYKLPARKKKRGTCGALTTSDPKMILGQAEDFRRASIRLEGPFYEKTAFGVVPIYRDLNTFFPQAVFDALSFELYLKFAVAIATNSNPPRGHLLHKLFKKLPADWQQAVRDRWHDAGHVEQRRLIEQASGTVHPDFEESLRSGTAAFQAFRYVFDPSLGSLEAPWGNIRESLRSEIFDRYPNLYEDVRLRLPLGVFNVQQQNEYGWDHRI